jgi:hypothetical protein
MSILAYIRIEPLPGYRVIIYLHYYYYLQLKRV